MALLDEIGGKIASAGKRANKALSDISQVAIIKDSIDAEQSKIVQLYTALGKTYYYSNSDKVKGEPFSSLCSQVKGHLDAIRQYEEEIKKIQNTTECPRCGTACVYNSSFCTNCRYEFSKESGEVVSDPRVCLGCGAPLVLGASFCADCGQPVADVKSEHSTDQENVNGYKYVSNNNKLLCPKCDAELIDKAMFCAECGSPIEKL